ncbi:MAG: GspH/FimT family pseudopilin [Planctomycetota bacterium]|jgi:prepilin-type N-terminal cleavage/methylation domain-containing protein
MRSPSTTGRGFTLFELVLVLLLLALAASIVAPGALYLSERRMDASLRNAHAMARHARSLAVTRGIATRMCIDSDARRFWLEIENDPFNHPGVFESVGDEWGEGIQLLETVRFDFVDVDQITFRPDGTAEDALIILAETNGERRGLEVRGITGLSRILEGEEMDYLAGRMADDQGAQLGSSSGVFR